MHCSSEVSVTETFSRSTIFVVRGWTDKADKIIPRIVCLCKLFPFLIVLSNLTPIVTHVPKFYISRLHVLRLNIILLTN